jgi:hypothetical protein
LESWQQPTIKKKSKLIPWKTEYLLNRTVLPSTMLSHVRHLGKRHVAIRAGERLLSGVDPDVVLGVRRVDCFVVARAAEEDLCADIGDEPLPNPAASSVFTHSLRKTRNKDETGSKECQFFFLDSDKYQ